MPLDLVSANKEGLVRDVMTGGSLRYSNHNMVEFKILCGRSRVISRSATLDFRGAIFGFFKDLLGGIPWARAVEGKGDHESWLSLKHHFFQAQDQSKKLGKVGKRPARNSWIT